MTAQEPTLDDLAKILKSVYFNYMIYHPAPDYEQFKKTQLECSAIILDKINSKYSDHVEGARKEWNSLPNVN